MASPSPWTSRPPVPTNMATRGPPAFASEYPTVGMNTPPLPSASTPWYGEEPGIMAKVLQGAWDAVDFPAAAVRGEVDPTSDEGIARATDLAGMVTLGAGGVPGAGLRMGARRPPPMAKPDTTGWRVETVGTPDYYSTNRNTRLYNPEGQLVSQRSPSIRLTDEDIILEHLGYKPPVAPKKAPTRPAIEFKDAPEYKAPPVNWNARDLQDAGTEASIMKEFGRGSGKIVRGYVDEAMLPKPGGAGITKEGLPTRKGGYGYEDLERRGEPPPIKVRIDKKGKVTLLDGNHRLAFWREQGYSDIPVYAIDERVGESVRDTIMRAMDDDE